MNVCSVSPPGVHGTAGYWGYRHLEGTINVQFPVLVLHLLTFPNLSIPISFSRLEWRENTSQLKRPVQCSKIIKNASACNNSFGQNKTSPRLSGANILATSSVGRLFWCSTVFSYNTHSDFQVISYIKKTTELHPKDFCFMGRRLMVYDVPPF